MTYHGEINDNIDGKLIYRGAEADLILSSWGGEPAIFKVRNPLPYRLNELDRKIRERRTLHEAEMLHDAKKAGINAPYVYFLDLENTTIVMQYIDAPRLKELIPGLSEGSLCKLFFELGVTIAKMHNANIIHGDLTTSNVLIAKQRLFLVDFGLSIHSTRLEDRAVDLRLIKEIMTATHPRISEIALGSIFDGYRSVVGDERLEDIKWKVREIERRGRYARVE